MEWWLFLLLFLLGLMVLMLLGMPVAFAFFTVNIVSAVFIMGFWSGPRLLLLNMFRSLASFTLAPIPFFVLMGEIFFHSGIAQRGLRTMKMFLGRIPARQAIIGGLGGTIFSALTGSTMANTAMLGSLLVPEMRKQGYSKSMSIGPLLATGGLAMVIPPSALAVLLGSVGKISIGKLLIGGLLPGILMATLYGVYVISRALLFPNEVPGDGEVESVSLLTKIRAFIVDIVPLSVVIFLVIGFILLGYATPTESAALGALGTLLLTFYFQTFDWQMLRQSLFGTLKITSMTLLILAGSVGFSQLLSYTGASRTLVQTVVGLDVTPVMILVLIQLMILVLGTFMDQAAMIMLVTPLVMPIVDQLGWDPVWFGIVMLLSLEIGLTSPPFGLLNFVMKSITPPDVSIKDIWKAALPFIVCDIIALALIISFPGIVTLLPSLMD